MKRSHLGLVAAMFLAATFPAPSGWAQSTSDKVAAEGLFDQGRAAMQRGDFAQACGLLERSQRTDPAVGTLLYLAECYEKSGRTASAWATFREAADAADAAHEASRAKVGRDRAARLEPHLARLTIQIGADTEQLTGLTIERSGQTVPTATWNVAVPVDPGDQTITVSAPGYDPWTTTVTVPAKAASVSITVPQLRRNPDAEKVAPPPAATTAAVAATAPNPDEARTDVSATAAPATSEQPGKTQRTIAYAVGGAGVVGIVVGSIFGLKAISKNNDAENLCKTTSCDNTQGIAFAEDAKSAANVSNVAFAVGIAALAGGAILYFTAPRAETPTAATLRARAGLGHVALEGTF